MSRNFIDIPHEILSSKIKRRVSAEQLNKILDEQPEKLVSWEPIIPKFHRLPFSRSKNLIMFNVVLSR